MFGDLFEPKHFDSFFSENTLSTTFELSISDSKTRGVDGETPQMFSKELDENVKRISESVVSGKYRFTRFKEKLILKGAKQPPREVFIPTVSDRLVLRCLHDYLAEKFPAAHTPLPHTCIKAIKTRLKSTDQSLCFLRVDIKNFYPSIWHGKLMVEILKVVTDKTCLNLIKSAISTTAHKKELSKRGVPQGLSISNRLANIMLERSDEIFREKFGSENYFRYVDDILVITKVDSAVSDFSEIAKALKTAGLVVHGLDAKGVTKSKSQIRALDIGVEYLGFSLKSNRISVRKASLKRMYDRIVGLITGLKYERNFGRVSFKLDLMISGCIFKGKRFGWLHFFQQSDDVSQLVNLDRFVKRLKVVSKIPNEHKVKSFVKAYHEIKYNSANTKYVPNFDDASLDFKKAILVKFGNSPDIELWTLEKIDSRFFSIVSKMARELEQDILEPTS